jgi:N-acetylmuramoyl-L-alanine amidase
MTRGILNRRSLVVGAVVGLFGACSRVFTGVGKFHPPSEAADLDDNQDSKGTDQSNQGDNPIKIADSAVSAGEGDQTLLPGSPSSGTGSLLGLKVALDVGHSGAGDDRGAFGDAVSEYLLNVEEANLVARKLREKGAFVSLFHYPNTTELDERGQNAAGHHVFVSIHHNAFSSRLIQGTEVLINHPEHRGTDQKLAVAVQGSLMKNVWGSLANDTLDRGAKAQALGVLRNTPKTVLACCLAEAFFITENGMTRSKAQELVAKAAQGIASGIESFWLGNKSKMLLLDHNDFQQFSDQSISNEEDFVAWPLSESNEDLAGIYDGH